MKAFITNKGIGWTARIREGTTPYVKIGCRWFSPTDWKKVMKAFDRVQSGEREFVKFSVHWNDYFLAKKGMGRVSYYMNTPLRKPDKDHLARFEVEVTNADLRRLDRGM